MKEYLVTGAGGFIGASIAEKLLKGGENKVVTIDNFTTGRRNHVPKGCEIIEGNDFEDYVLAKLGNRKFEAVIHIAGQSSGEISFDDPEYDLNTNTLSTLKLLQYCKRTGCHKFIYSSSMAVYGDQKNPFVSEETTAVPKSFYAVGKLASENYMRIFSGDDLKCTALRFFNVYGIGQNLDNLRQGMASIYLAMAIKDRHINVKGAKDRFRDFVYIEDIVDAVLTAERAETGHNFDIFNVSCGKPQTVESIIDIIRESLPYDVTVEYTAGTPGDQHGIYGHNEKIKRVLGWEPKISFNEGMRLMIEWARREIEK